MGKGSVTLSIVAAICIGSLAAAQPVDPSTYTVPAREKLFSGTISGIVEAYGILEDGINDQNVTGDKRELILLHVLARAGMLVFDTSDTAVSTSIVELVEPFGITVAGDKLFPEDPCDPARVMINLPLNPADPNCIQIPPGVDPEAALNTINTVIGPELDSIIAELGQIANTPTAFTMMLTPAETGLASDVEVDYGDVLALRAALLGAKAFVYGAGHPAYNLLVDPANPLFTGWECGILPPTTKLSDVLNAYPNLLGILPTTGTAALSQAKQHLIAALNAIDAALDHIEAEADDQMDDLLQVEASDSSYALFRSEFDKLRGSLQTNRVATYTLGSEQVFTLRDAGTPIGDFGLLYDFWRDEGTGYIKLSDPDPGVPAWWDIDWLKFDNGQIEGDIEVWTQDGNLWGWFEGTVSANGSLITITTLQYQGWYGGSWQEVTVNTLSAQRKSSQTLTGRFNPNPFFAGSVSPRDVLPQLDPNGVPIPGTFGHGLGDDATLAGVFPDMTQQDWLPWGYEVWAGDTDYREEPGSWTIFSNIDKHGYKKLGASNGGSLTVAGNYQYYVIAARGATLVDAVRGSTGSYYSGPSIAGNVRDPANYLGAPDDLHSTVGDDEAFAFFRDSFSGYIVLVNPGNWTGLTVLTGGGQITATATVNPGQVVANGTSSSTITITVKDEEGNPLQGVAPEDIEVSATGSGHTITQPTTATDSLGQTKAGIVSTETDPAKRINVTVYDRTFSEVATVVFTTGPTTKLAFVAQPVGPYVAGAPINAIPRVAVQDATGNTITSSTAQITIAIGTNPGGGTLSGTKTVAAVDGIATFPGLSINKAGTGYTLRATSGSLTAAVSQAFNVIADASSAQLVFAQSPQTTPAMAVLTPNPQVAIRDAFGNTVTTLTPDVTVGIKAGTGTAGAELNGTTTVAAVGGVATFNDLTINRQGDDYQLTATATDIVGSVDSQAFDITAEPALKVTKHDSADPVDVGDEVTYTITYGNEGLADGQNVVITETLPSGLEFVSAADEGTHTAGVITWDVGVVPAETPEAGTVSFVARVSNTMADGGRITNSNLWIAGDNADPAGQVTAETTTVNDTQPPVVTPVVPAANAVQVPKTTQVRLQITDNSGVDYAGETVTIHIEGDLIYDGANETSPGVYDSSSSEQAIRGVCRRTGATPTSYTFTFLPSAPFGYEKTIDVTVNASDTEGNSAESAYHFTTQMRTFGRNQKVNSDTDSTVQDNPATAADSQGNIWAVWEHTSKAGNTDVYVGILPADGSAFRASVPVTNTANNERRPTIAIDADDVAYVAWQADDPNGYWDVFVSSSSDGTTWSTPVKVVTGDTHNTSNQIKPSLGIDAIAPYTIYAAYQDNRAGNNDIWVATSTDGTTWSETQVTSDPSEQTDPVVGAFDPSSTGYVLWTDARNAADSNGLDIYGASPFEEWLNRKVVTGPGDDHSPATAKAYGLAHVLWIRSAGAFSDVFYGNDAADLPIIGGGIADEPNLVAGSPAISVMADSGVVTVFATWQDNRDAASGDAGDIYFAESASEFGTNILVNDDTGTAVQSNPAIGIDSVGDPYIVWADKRNRNNDIYYAGSTAIGPPLATTVTISDGVTTVTAVVPGDPDASVAVEIPDDAMPEGIEVGDITVSQVSELPELPPAGGLAIGFEFGPTGTVFLKPVTIRIPLPEDTPRYAVYTVYWYDLQTLSWTTEGIHNPATKVTTATGAYLEVEVDHFTTFGAGGRSAGGGGGGGGGGCALAPWSDVSWIEFMVPFVAFVLVLLTVTAVDGVRRRSHNVRR